MKIIAEDFPILETKNLILERLTIKHLSEQYVGWMNDPAVNMYLDSGGDYSMGKLREYLMSVEEKNIFFWAILNRKNGNHIGNIKIDPINSKSESGEYGILIGDKTEWGNGYAYEASDVVLKYCFQELELKKITLGVIADNIAAITLYKKLGFIEEGYHRMYAKYNGKYCDLLRMTLFDINNQDVIKYFNENNYNQ